MLLCIVQTQDSMLNKLELSFALLSFFVGELLAWNKKKMLVLSFLMSQSCLENASPGSTWEYAIMYTEATYSLCHFLTFSCCGIFLKRKPYIKRTISSPENQIWQTKSVSSNLVSLQMQNCSSHNSQTCGLIAAWQIWKLSFQIKSNQTKLNLYYCHRPA